MANNGNGRYRFDAADMLRQARGLPTPEGYVVITKPFADFLLSELERMYQIHDTVRDFLSRSGGVAVEGSVVDSLARILDIEVK